MLPWSCLWQPIIVPNFRHNYEIISTSIYLKRRRKRGRRSDSRPSPGFMSILWDSLGFFQVPERRRDRNLGPQEENMKKYEGIMKDKLRIWRKHEEIWRKYKKNMKKYEENMKKYEGITLPIYRPWDLEKFRACRGRWRGGSQNTSWGGRWEQRHETCQKYIKLP